METGAHGFMVLCILDIAKDDVVDPKNDGKCQRQNIASTKFCHLKL